MDDEIEVCRGCARSLAETSGDGPAIGLIEDGVLLCRECAMEARREFDLPPLDAA